MYCITCLATLAVQTIMCFNLLTCQLLYSHYIYNIYILDFTATSLVRDCRTSFNNVSSIADNEPAFGEPVSLINVDDLMRMAYGTTLIDTGGSGIDSL